MNNKCGPILAIIKSFSYAIQGIAYCVRSERNFRIHIVAALYSLLLAFYLELDAVRFMILLIVIGGVMAAEMINTSFEAFVDLMSPQVHDLAKVTKDVAAGAVLVCAALSVGVGIKLFWQPEKLLVLLKTVVASPICLTAVGLSVLFSFCFILLPVKQAER